MKISLLTLGLTCLWFGSPAQAVDNSSDVVAKAEQLFDDSMAAYRRLDGLSMSYATFNDDGVKYNPDLGTIRFQSDGRAHLEFRSAYPDLLLTEPLGAGAPVARAALGEAMLGIPGGAGPMLSALLQGQNLVREPSFLARGTKWEGVKLLPDNGLAMITKLPPSAGKGEIRFSLYFDPSDHLLRRVDVKGRTLGRTFRNYTLFGQVEIDPQFAENTFAVPSPSGRYVSKSSQLGVVLPGHDPTESIDRGYQPFARPKPLTAAQIAARKRGLRGKILFLSDRDGRDEIYVMNADGSAQTRLPHNAHIVANPRFSPDGTRIVFDSPQGDGGSVYLMNADGTQTRLLAKDGMQSRFSGDGKKVLFVSQGEIHQINLDGTGLTDLKVRGQEPTLAPDNRHLVFTVIDSFYSELYSHDLNGSKDAELTERLGAENACFAPDGKQVAFLARGRLMLMDANGSNKRSVTYRNFDDWSTAGALFNRIWPHRENLYDDSGFSWSPDGQKFAVASMMGDGDKSQIYVVGADGLSLVRLTSRGNNTAPSWAPGRVR